MIVFNLSGHGHFDMGAYDAYLAGALQDYAYPAEAIQQALAELPQVAVTVYPVSRSASVAHATNSRITPPSPSATDGSSNHTPPS